MIKKLSKLKILNVFLLTMVLIVSLFFFTACDDEDEEDKLLVKVVYRPYSSSKPYALGKTYGELIEENLLDLSEDFLTRMVGEYGIGEVSVKDGDSTTTVMPENTIDYQNLLGISSALNETQKMGYAKELSTLTNAYYQNASGAYILILSNYSVNSSTAATIVEYADSAYKAKTNLTKISSAGGSISANTNIDVNSVCKYSNGNKLSYVFVGGNVGSNSYKSTTNAKAFVLSLLSSPFNAIQHYVTGVEIQNDTDVNIQSSSWTCSLTNSEMSSINTSQNYLTAYLNKFKLSFAVEIAKTILTRYDGCELNSSLQGLYSSASQTAASENSKRTFISECCEYIDHLGLLDEEISILTNFFKQNFVGTLSSTSSLKIDEKCANAMSNTKQNYEMKPILEYKTYQDTLEEFDVEGTIQSLIIMSKKQYDFSGIFFEFETDDNVPNISFTLRCYNDDGKKVVPFSFSSDDFKNRAVDFDVADITDEFDSFAIKDSEDNLTSDADSSSNTIKDNASNMFAYSKLNLNADGCCWCYNDIGNVYVEISFGCDNLCEQFQFKFISIFL